MRNFVKRFGLILFVTVIGFSMVSCDIDFSEGATLKVVNKYAYPITRVVVTGGLLDEKNLSITITQSFPIDNDQSKKDEFSNLYIVYVYAEGLTGGGIASTGIVFGHGQTTTVTLGPDGRLVDTTY